MKKIGITGGSGLLGKLLIKELKKKKIKYSIFKGDIVNKAHIRNWILKNKKIDYIFHLAAYTAAVISKGNQKKAYRINVKGTENLLDIINLQKKKINLFFSSTSHVYEYSKKPIKESFFLKPTNYYGKTKLLAEKKIVKNKNFLFKYCIARIFSIYHNSQKKPFLYPSIKHKLKKTKLDNIQIKGANNVRDFTNADKIVKIFIKIYKKKINGIYNVGSGKGITIKEFIKKKIDKKKNIFDNQKPNFLIADVKKLKSRIK